MRLQTSTEPSGVRGLLALLCRVLIIWQPLSLGLIASSALNSLSVRGLPLALAQASLLLSAAADIFVYATPYVPNNRPPGDSALILAASLLWYGGWLMYLWRSRRVRETFGFVDRHSGSSTNG